MKGKAVILKKGREKSLDRKHPWIFTGAVKEVTGSPDNGETVEIVQYNGENMGVGSISHNSQIIVRMWSFDPGEVINDAFFYCRISDALKRRNISGIPENTNAFRVVNAESDGLPGLIVDKYNNILVCQFLSAGAEFFKSEIVRQLSEIMHPSAVYERSDSESRVKEGLEKKCGLLKGSLPETPINIKEHGIQYRVDVVNGHKTGFYLDQRDNRSILGNMSRNMDVLNCFSYTGGFGLNALVGGANSITSIDVSEVAMQQAMNNVRLNNCDLSKITNITGDVFQHLRQFRDKGSTFDIVVLDPPKFAASVSQLPKAARGYKDINLLAMKLLKPGGLLFTFSCSGHMVPELFRKIISDAAIDADCKVYFEQTLQQSTDHPVLMSFPESHYLKGYICRVWKK
jgi:23S rRNA (cytosine1962-C5)-methyltransferase